MQRMICRPARILDVFSFGAKDGAGLAAGDSSGFSISATTEER
jgi:hypothetical protein